MTIREDIFKAEDLPREFVPTPEWSAVDGQVYARCLSGDERDKYEVYLANQSEPEPGGGEDTRRMKMGTTHLRAMLVAMGACDEHGDSIFRDSDLVQLGMKSADVLERLRTVIRRLSGMDDDEEKTAKNLPVAPGDSSFTDLPSPSDTPALEECSES